jgi:hypothetical protein
MVNMVKQAAHKFFVYLCLGTALLPRNVSVASFVHTYYISIPHTGGTVAGVRAPQNFCWQFQGQLYHVYIL